MTHLTTHTIDSAPESSRPLMEKGAAKYGFTPNLLGVLAGSPAALEAYMQVSASFAKSAFDPIEQQVVLMTVSYENSCHYCMAAHSTGVASMPGAPAGLLEALRSGSSIEDPKLEALANLTREVVREDGWPSGPSLEAFFAAGYAESHLLDVLVGVAQKTISNYVNHLSETVVDDAFAAQAWSGQSS